MHTLFLLFFLIFLAVQGRCIEVDTLLAMKEKDRGPKYLTYLAIGVPIMAITYGAIARMSPVLKNIDNAMDNEVQEHVGLKIPLDDYFQYAPLVGYLGLDLCGIKAKHRFTERLAVAATAYAIMAITVNTMKATIHALRPDYSANNSFPSGHTATAFTGAHLLLREYWDVSPWIGVAGYGIATATGTLRVLNKKHWVSDVITGMGIGVISAELAYYILPFYQRIFKNRSTNVTLLPQLNNQSVGLYFSYQF